MKKTTVLIVLFCTVIAFAQKKEKVKGSKIITTTISDLENFENIELSDNLKIYLVKAEKPSLEIEADDNLHDAINYSVMGNTLRIASQKDVISAKKFSIRVNYSDELKLIIVKDEAKLYALAELELNDITVKNYDKSESFLNVKSKSFTFILNDKAEAELNIKAQNTILELSKNTELKALITTSELKLDMYENSKGKIEGNTDNAKIRLDNNCNLNSQKFTIKNLDLTTEGYAKADVNVTNTISVSASGRSEIKLFSEPKITITKFTNTATIYKKEL